MWCGVICMNRGLACKRNERYTCGWSKFWKPHISKWQRIKHVNRSHWNGQRLPAEMWVMKRSEAICTGRLNKEAVDAAERSRISCQRW